MWWDTKLNVAEAAMAVIGALGTIDAIWAVFARQWDQAVPLGVLGVGLLVAVYLRKRRKKDAQGS